MRQKKKFVSIGYWLQKNRLSGDFISAVGSGPILAEKNQKTSTCFWAIFGGVKSASTSLSLSGSRLHDKCGNKWEIRTEDKLSEIADAV